METEDDYRSRKVMQDTDRLSSSWTKILIWAFFVTPKGAAEALLTLRGAGHASLVSAESSALVEKDAEGNLALNDAGDLSLWMGLGTSEFMRDLVRAVFPGASLFTGATNNETTLNLAGRLYDARTAPEQLKATASRMPVSSSALLAVSPRARLGSLDKHQWRDDVLQYLHQVASNVGWLPISDDWARNSERRRENL